MQADPGRTDGDHHRAAGHRARQGPGPPAQPVPPTTPPNAPLRNVRRAQTTQSEMGFPPLALNLYYLITAYGEAAHDEDPRSPPILGCAMSMLHDHPLLGPADSRRRSPERPRPADRAGAADAHAITTEEMWRLWSTFPTPYRTSVAYQVSVVLIDSTRSPRAQLPALGRGVAAQGSTQPPPPPFPAISSVVLPAGQPARLGDSLVRRQPPRRAALTRAPRRARSARPRLASLPGATAPTRRCTCPARRGPGRWRTGVYRRSSALAQRPARLAPRRAARPRARHPGPPPTAVGRRRLTHRHLPAARAARAARLTLLLGSRAVDAAPRTVQVAQHSFLVPSAPLGRQLVRLRVDGVDSLIVDFTATPPAFDLAQSVEVVPSPAPPPAGWRPTAAHRRAGAGAMSAGTAARPARPRRTEPPAAPPPPKAPAPAPAAAPSSAAGAPAPAPATIPWSSVCLGGGPHRDAAPPPPPLLPPIGGGRQSRPPAEIGSRHARAVARPRRARAPSA